MTQVFGLPRLRQVSDDWDERLRQCDHGEGIACATQQDRIDLHVKASEALIGMVRAWGKAVFAGQTEYDADIERLLLDRLARLTTRCPDVAAQGRSMDGECWRFERLAEPITPAKN